MRVASLLPSATEVCYAVGVDPVGVSHSCDYPPAARSRPVLTSTAIDDGPDRSAGDVDDQVTAASGSLYDLDDALLASLDPDVIVTQATCDVCAVDERDVRDAVATHGIDAEVVTLDPDSLGDVLDDVRRVGAAVDRADEAAAAVAAMDRRIDRVEAAAADAVADAGRPRTLVFDWTDPAMVAGHWIPGMVAAAGGTYGLREAGDASRPVEWATVREFDPERIVVAPCGFELDRAVDAAADLSDRPGWGELTAVREGAVYAVDGSGLVNRPGPRLVDTLEAVAACLHGVVDPDPEAVRRLDRAPA